MNILLNKPIWSRGIYNGFSRSTRLNDGHFGNLFHSALELNTWIMADLLYNYTVHYIGCLNRNERM